jgi:hypothetical protein
MYDVLYCTLFDRMCSLQYSTVCTMNMTPRNQSETAGVLMPLQQTTDDGHGLQQADDDGLQQADDG